MATSGDRKLATDTQWTQHLRLWLIGHDDLTALVEQEQLRTEVYWVGRTSVCCKTGEQGANVVAIASRLFDDLDADGGLRARPGEPAEQGRQRGGCAMRWQATRVSLRTGLCTAQWMHGLRTVVPQVRYSR